MSPAISPDATNQKTKPLDPNSIPSTANLTFLNHIWEGLVCYDPAFGPKPALATEWELVRGPAWRFKLREGVKLHDGADMTADDVGASFQRAADPASPLKATCRCSRTSRRSMT
ncbi:ABC transporter substrate-binding protein [Paracoccus sp. WLY502]|uniref:ABC transporter substrate-binding protein n=1 Tax=Paracoccus yibinensis TaxID=3068891 RepID=UPI00279699D7|nr:ABC transporter substrate-binding protein [Paracoccus sp. WLY502]MDQ1901212.1 ABC transporter substrate-binding protein [Paracoccus sp. WLY502]